MFFQALNEQSALRAASALSDMQSYILLRRDDGGVRASFVLIEYAAGTDLSEEVMEHPIVRRMANAANDLVCWSNVGRFSAPRSLKTDLF